METNIELSHSKSPSKPKLLLKYLKRHKIQEEYLEIEHFKPFSKNDFLIAHIEEYVEAMYKEIKPSSILQGIIKTQISIICVVFQ
jgi:hypothetical protein